MALPSRFSEHFGAAENAEDKDDHLSTSPTGSHPSLHHTASTWSVSTRSSTNVSELISISYAELESKYDFETDISKISDIQELQQRHRLPKAKGNDEAINQLRHGFFTIYRRLFLLVLVINTAALATMIELTRSGHYNATYEMAATAAGANLFAAALTRHEHFINLLFRLATSLPYGTPLCIRHQAAKVYHYGGVHSGCGTSAFFWFLFYTVLLVQQFVGTYVESVLVIATACIALCALLSVIVMALPSIRRRHHDAWETVHRYGGWTAVGVIWGQTVVIALATARSSRKPLWLVLLTTPTFWFLVVITCFLVYPWLRLRKVSVRPEVLSSHAVRLWFNHRSLPICAATRLSKSPLRETHGFATIPNQPDQEKGFSCIVSDAGDWTKELIANPPRRIWIKGAPTLGVMRVATLFRPVVIVTTGSGIGPCLSFLSVKSNYPVRVLWSARSPVDTYGPDIMKAVLRADPKAVIVDTQRTGHPDILHLSWALYKEAGAEAVVCISNPLVTHSVVYGLESRGVPAFGAIFDS